MSVYIKNLLYKNTDKLIKKFNNYKHTLIKFLIIVPLPLLSINDSVFKDNVDVLFLLKYSVLLLE